jgi:hypothetical protein
VNALSTAQKTSVKSRSTPITAVASGPAFDCPVAEAPEAAEAPEEGEEGEEGDEREREERRHRAYTGKTMSSRIMDVMRKVTSVSMRDLV